MRGLSFTLVVICLMAISAQAAEQVNGAALFTSFVGAGFSISGDNTSIRSSLPDASSGPFCNEGTRCAFMASGSGGTTTAARQITWTIEGYVLNTIAGSRSNCYEGVCADAVVGSLIFTSSAIRVPQLADGDQVTISVPVHVSGTLTGVNRDPNTGDLTPVYTFSVRGRGKVSYTLNGLATGQATIATASWTFNGITK